MSKLQEELLKLQKEINVPKDRYSDYGNYSYRNLTDIISATRKHGTSIMFTFTDELLQVGSGVYVKSICRAQLGDEIIESAGFAQEEALATAKNKKASAPQLTGSASTFARKYAINALLNLDDAQDPDDLTSKQAEAPKQAAKPAPQKAAKPAAQPAQKAATPAKKPASKPAAKPAKPAQKGTASKEIKEATECAEAIKNMTTQMKETNTACTQDFIDEITGKIDAIRPKLTEELNDRLDELLSDLIVTKSETEEEIPF